MSKVFSKNKPEKSLVRILKKKSGRSNTGRITIRHRGGRAKRYYRLIEFAQGEIPWQGKVESIEYDPNRTAYIALVVFKNKEGKDKKIYILAPQELKVGDKVIYDEKTPISPANRLQLKYIPIGTFVYNIELEPGRGGRIARSAGNYCQVMGQEGKYTFLKMPSSEERKILSTCFASIGQLSNSQHRFSKVGKAGRKRLMGWRPTVRGSAMNAIDHPHGGGKNKAPIGMKYPKTPWGKHALGVKTRNVKKWTDKLIVKRRIKKK